MILYCHARALDEAMSLKSLALASEDDAHLFSASSSDDPAAVRSGLREFIAQVTAADGGKQPVIAVEGFGFDQPVPKLIFEKAHGLFPSGMGAMVYWLDISPAVHDSAPRPLDLVAAVRAVRDEYLARQPRANGPLLP